MTLLELLADGKVDEFNATRGRYSSPDLFAADLSSRNLAGVDLSGANLEKADLSKSNLSGAVMLGANLSGADLTGASLDGVVAVKSRWRDAFLGEAQLDGADFTRADFTGADLTGSHGDGVKFSHAKLKDANLSGVSLPEVHMDQATLAGADLTRAEMQRGDFQEANLGKARLDGANLDGSDLSGAHLPGASARGTHLEGCTLRGIDLSSAQLEGACLDGSDLTRADLTGASLQGASLRQADLRETRLDGVDLSVADTDGAVLALPVSEEADAEEEFTWVPVQFGDFQACLSGERIGVLWENEEPDEVVALRVAVVSPRVPWDGRSIALPDPADLVIARALVPSENGFRALLFVERPAGLVCRLADIGPGGAITSMRTLPFDYVPAVRPVLVTRPDGFYVIGLSRNGPLIQVHRWEGEGLVPIFREKVPTARGFAGNEEPVLVCKGGVVIPVSPEGLGRPVRSPETFPGRSPTACRFKDDVFLAWIEPGAQGFRYCFARSGADPYVERMLPRVGISSLDAARFGNRILVAFTREGDELRSPTGLNGVWFPGGRPFPLVPNLESDAEEIRFVYGSNHPVVAASTLDASLVVVEVDGETGRPLFQLKGSVEE